MKKAPVGGPDHIRQSARSDVMESRVTCERRGIVRACQRHMLPTRKVHSRVPTPPHYLGVGEGVGEMENIGLGHAIDGGVVVRARRDVNHIMRAASEGQGLADREADVEGAVPGLGYKCFIGVADSIVKQRLRTKHGDMPTPTGRNNLITEAGARRDIVAAATAEDVVASAVSKFENLVRAHRIAHDVVGPIA
jgi:hypothetical protein